MPWVKLALPNENWAQPAGADKKNRVSFDARPFFCLRPFLEIESNIENSPAVLNRGGALRQPRTPECFAFFSAPKWAPGLGRHQSSGTFSFSQIPSRR